ncbi:MAG: bacteriorhodopsin-like [Micrococcales bacterium]
MTLALDYGSHSAIYNMLSLGIASMTFTAFFLWFARDRVLPRYRTAIMVSASVVSIAAYHYFRMYDSFNKAAGEMGADGSYQLNVAEYNVGYRYVDWFLTVPLLLVEVVAVLALARSVQSSLLKRLVPAAALMIALGYPGDARLDNVFGLVLKPEVWGLLSTIPFVYILYVLLFELSKSLERQSDAVKKKVTALRILLFASWGVYPISFIANMQAAAPTADGFMLREVGYTIADITAKCVFGLIIYSIARIKSAEDSKEFAASEFKD